jgi:galactokinase
MACRAICKKLCLPQDDSTKVLKDLMEVYFEKHPLQLGKEDARVQQVWDTFGEEAAKISKMQEVALSSLPEHPLSRHEVEEATGYSGADFDKEFLSDFPSE